MITGVTLRKIIKSIKSLTKSIKRKEVFKGETFTKIIKKFKGSTKNYRKNEVIKPVTIKSITRRIKGLVRIILSGFVATSAVLPAATTINSVNALKDGKEESKKLSVDNYKKASSMQEAKDNLDEAHAIVDQVTPPYNNALNEFNNATASKNQAQTRKNEADTALTNAINNAQKAFNDALTSSKDGYASASAELTDAMNKKTEIEGMIETSKKALTDAETALKEAQDALTEVQGKVGNVSQEDVDAANEAYTQAKTIYETALKASEEAKQNVKDAEDKIATIESQIASYDNQLVTANKKQADSKKALDNAVTKVANYQTVVDALENGFADSQEYKDAVAGLEAAKEETTKANEEYLKTVATVEKLEGEKANIVKEKTAAEEVLATKQGDLTKKQEELDSAKLALKNTEDSITKLDGDVADLNAQIETAKAQVSVKESEVEAAKAAVETATTNLTTANNNVAKAQAKVDTINAQLANITTNTQTGILGFINYMLTKDGLTNLQIADLLEAKSLISEAQAINMKDVANLGYTFYPFRSGADKVVVLNDSKDATSIANVQIALDTLKSINNARRSDNNFAFQNNSVGNTNFAFLVGGAVEANVGAAYHAHTRLYWAGENEGLAFGGQAVHQWYNEEKVDFDKYKAKLGYKTITNMDQIYAIEDAANADGVVVGHYTGLFRYGNALIATGHNSYNINFYGVVPMSTTDAYSVGENSSERYSYTPEEMQNLLNEYKASLDANKVKAQLAAAQKDLQTAKTNQTNANNSLNTANKNLQTANDNLTAVNESISTMQSDIASKNKEIADAKKAIPEIQAEITSIEASIPTYQQAITEAQRTVDAIDGRISDKQKEVDQAQQVSDTAKAKLDDKTTAQQIAQEYVDGFSSSLAEAKRNLEAAKEEQASAQSQYDKDVSAVTDLENSKAQTQNLLATAKDELTIKNNTLTDKLADTATKQGTMDQEEDKYEETMEKYTNLMNAEAAVTKAKQTQQDTIDRLVKLDGDLAAIAKVINDKQANLKTAKDKLAKAETLSYEDALENPVTEEEFTYLNDYINKQRAAESAVETAQSELDEAIRYETEKQSAYHLASKEFNRAYSLLAMAQADYDHFKSLVSNNGSKKETNDKVMTSDDSITSVWLTTMVLSGAMMTITMKKRKEDNV